MAGSFRFSKDSLLIPEGQKAGMGTRANYYAQNRERIRVQMWPFLRGSKWHNSVGIQRLQLICDP